MRVQVKKCGNSASVRIPAAIMASASLHIDQEVDIQEKNGRIIINPIITSFSLNDLLARMTPETFPETVEFGPAVGNEIW